MTMEQIADWLEKRGMSEYTQRFIENHIDLSVLPDLTEEDLEKLGVLLGDRRKMLRWIADLKAGENVPLASGIAAAAPEVRGLAESAERRQVTVMFSDLVGSTALSARMDPEDLREVVLAYQNVVAETVSRFDGFVAEYHGDGVLVYMGGIDDQPSARLEDLKIAKNYVDQALTEMAQGKPVSASRSRAYGCSVKYAS